MVMQKYPGRGQATSAVVCLPVYTEIPGRTVF